MQLTANNKGFTLIEVVAVMVIVSVMASLSIKKLDLVSHTASDRVIENGLRELNTRETLVWTQIKLSDGGWVNDANLFSELDTNLGQDFSWTAEPTVAGGTLQFRSTSITLTRTPSSNVSVGSWH
jgi:prepilin-type N-terminal cleavage/methylation domain-containing protein